MEDKLDFSLPVKKQKPAYPFAVLVLLLIVLIGLTIMTLFNQLNPRTMSENAVSSLSQEKAKDLASKLADRNLYVRAAAVWQDYLASSRVPDSERAKTLFQIGTLLENAGNCDEAIEYYYRSEMTAKLPELEQTIHVHLKDCFEKLGQFSALRYELMDRTRFQAAEKAGSKIVAEIGPEKITEAALDAQIESAIDHQLTPMKAFTTTEQQNEQKKKMLEQYKSPSAKQQFLQSWLVQEILYRQALEEKLSDQPDVKQLIEYLVRGVLSQQRMDKELADKIHITESDLQTYYLANKSTYMEPPKAKISHIVVKDQEEAEKLLKRIKDGGDFGETAKEYSADSTAKENGGNIDVDITKGDSIPGIGEIPELVEKILAANTGDILSEPFKTEKGWEIVKVRQKDGERQKTFDEVKQQVISSLLGHKRQEVQEDLMKQMMDKYNVIIHTSAFGNPDTSKAEDSASGTISK